MVYLKLGERIIRRSQTRHHSSHTVEIAKDAGVFVALISKLNE